MVGRGGRRGRRLSLTRTLALFPLFRRRFLGRGRAAQTKGSDAVSVNKAPAFKNSKSGLRCDEGTNVQKRVSIVDSYTNNIQHVKQQNNKITNKTYEKLQSLEQAWNKLHCYHKPSHCSRSVEEKIYKKWAVERDFFLLQTFTKLPKRGVYTLFREVDC